MPSSPGARRAGLAAAPLALLALQACAPVQDRVARQDVESLQTNVQQMESSLQARQAGVYEQIRELREEQSRLERLIEEGARQGKGVGQQVAELRERTSEELQRRDAAQAEQLARVGARLDGLQKGLQTVNDNLVAMSGFEKKQEERIAKIQEQFQGQLKVIVDEVGQENQTLTRAIGAVRADVEAARQETAGAREGLEQLQKTMQQIADQLAATQEQVQELAKRQEALRRAQAAAPARGGGQHTVRAGETLTTIAARYGVSVQSLMEKNQIADADSIREGQKLVIPEH